MNQPVHLIYDPDYAEQELRFIGDCIELLHSVADMTPDQIEQVKQQARNLINHYGK
jgi:hypothetical protein